MKKLLFLIVLVFSITTVYAEVSTLQAIVNSLPSKYCPMRGLNGQSYCPNGGRVLSDAETYLANLPKDSPLVKGIQVQSGVSSTSDSPITVFTSSNDSSVSLFEILKDVEKENPPKVKSYDTTSVPRIIAGFGFDRVSREMKYPIYPTSDPAPSHHVAHDVRAFDNVYQFVDFAMGVHAHQQAGVYVREPNHIRQIAVQFGTDSSARIGLTQRTVRTHTTSISSNNPIDDFTMAINYLPPYNRHDPNVLEQYRMIIRFWGTDIALNVNHGGSIYQQTIIKKCFGGNIGEGMLNDLDSAINRRAPGSGYLQFRQLGIFEARGGNPEIGSDRMNERINTFAHAPAPIDWNTRPIWEAVADGTRRSWLHAAVVDYINENMPTIDSIKRDIAQAVENYYRSRRTLYHVDFNVEHAGGIVLRWTGCPVAHYRGGVYAPHCALLRSPFQLGANQGQSLGSAYPGTDTIVERNNEGLVRMRMVHNGNNVFVSDFIREGCTSVRQVGRWCDNGRCIDGHLVLLRAVCIDVLPHIVQYPGQHNQVQTRLEGVCRPYTIQSELHSLEKPILYTDQRLTSNDGRFVLVMQGDGNLCIYNNGGPGVWCTMSHGRGPGPWRLAMQGDGNLVIYNASNQAVWATNTSGRGTPPYRLALQNDRNLCVYGASGGVWCTMTNI